MKYIIILCLCILGTYNSLACADHALSFPGQNPLFGKNSLTVQYRIQHFTALEPVIQRSTMRTMHGGHGNTSPAYTSYNCAVESFTLSGQYFIGRKTKVFGQMGFFNNVAISNANTYNIAHNGDATVGFQHNILNHQPENRKWMYRLTGTMGLLLPTGYYNPTYNADIYHNIMPGKGSVGHLLGLSGIAKWRHTALAPEVSFQHNMPNKYAYKYGSTLQYQLRLMQYISYKSWQIVPNAGIQHLQIKTDRKAKTPEAGTANIVTYSTVALGIYYKKYGVNAEYSLPIQDAKTNGTTQKNMLNIQLSYSF